VSSLQFEIPMDMLGQMFGGGMQMQRPQESRWPQDVSSEIEADFEWLANTEWQVRRAPIARDGCPQNAWRRDHLLRVLHAGQASQIFVTLWRCYRIGLERVQAGGPTRQAPCGLSTLEP